MDAADVWRLVRLIRRLGPFDLIHGHNSKGGALARLAAHALGIPSIYTPNSFITQDQAVPSWQRYVFAKLERSLARPMAALIAVSHDEAEHARWLGIDPGKIHIIPNGVDPPVFPSRDAARERLGISAQEFVVGFVGRLAPQKAPEVMLEAFAAAFAKQSAARLVMVGSGPLAADVQRRVERLGLNSRVLLLGDVVATTVMPAFDVFCLSSRYEGMPYVLIEALAAGLPIVTTRVGGATMCVEPMHNGLIVPPDDIAALSAALATLASDAGLRRGFSAASAGFAARFTAQKMVDQTLRLYARVLAARKLQP
jgi:glycosyltransferase involved in cell wall biosynthesis